jgi:protein-S-isoprenylcysteine O-methyltransferase Ste14
VSDWLERLARRRIAVGYLYVPVFFWLARPTPRSLLLGAVSMLLGLALRLWASGYLRKGEVLATDGPYALCRNPLYLGSFLLLLGFAAGSGSIWLLAVSPVLFLLFYLPTMWHEEQQLGARFGASYQAYAVQTPRLLPRWPARWNGSQPWSWARVLRHREPTTTAIALIAYLLLVLRYFANP